MREIANNKSEMESDNPMKKRKYKRMYHVIFDMYYVICSLIPRVDFSLSMALKLALAVDVTRSELGSNAFSGSKDSRDVRVS